jgi:type IV pilus assembly protein PilY1
MPRPLLQRLAGLSTDVTTVARYHGLDGTVTRHMLDTDADGRITPASGDRAWLFLGLGRGGPGYYALDVTDPDRPRVLWSLGGSAASALGDAWPGAVVARMRLDDRRQSPHRLVVVLAGGHDPAQFAWPRSHDSRGARLLILDAETGEVLWQAAGPEADGADLILQELTASLPSAPRVLDADGDGFADTLYLLGVAGHLWRIDFSPGAEPSGVATARLLGQFGEADDSDIPPRRFYATPDVSYDAGGRRPRFIVSFGSGWLARPRDATTEDRFYAVFDAPGEAARAGTPEPSITLHDPDLFDVTPSPYTAPLDARGWLLRLVSHGRGEKTAGSSLTFDHRLRFTTYQPLAAEPERPCGPPASRSRLYTLDVRSGRPLNWIGDQPVPAEDLPVQGVPPGLRIVFPSRSLSAGCGPPGCNTSPIGLIGGRSLDLDFRNDPVKTTWRRLQPTAE